MSIGHKDYKKNDQVISSGFIPTNHIMRTPLSKRNDRIKKIIYHNNKGKNKYYDNAIMLNHSPKRLRSYTSNVISNY